MTKTPSPATPQPAICDYEGSTYRTDFWEGKGRDYEDAVERIILRQFLPKAARRYVDFGAGFGRLINEADRYDEVVIMDYSSTMLQDAQARLGAQIAISTSTPMCIGCRLRQIASTLGYCAVSSTTWPMRRLLSSKFGAALRQAAPLS